MTRFALPRDPCNVIITGVGGQGNVIASRMMGTMMVRAGCRVTIGETFGISQRGGSVMSHLRISSRSAWSPQIPSGKADSVMALEQIEAIRVLATYGNAQTTVLSNTRPIVPVGVIAGEKSYPAMEEIRSSLLRLAASVVFIDATQEAMKLGSAILGNVIMMGAVAGMGALPFGFAEFRETVRSSLPADRHEVNLTAFMKGMELMKQGR
jgi:indolepyruvate ferredoxin oxidoreductase, beta subunit